MKSHKRLDTLRLFYDFLSNYILYYVVRIKSVQNHTEIACSDFCTRFLCLHSIPICGLENLLNAMSLVSRESPGSDVEAVEISSVICKRRVRTLRIVTACFILCLYTFEWYSTALRHFGKQEPWTQLKPQSSISHRLDRNCHILLSTAISGIISA